MLHSSERSSLNTQYFTKVKHSTTCSYCGKEQKYVYLCSKCGSKLCKEHRKPEHHNCKHFKDKKPVEPIIKTPGKHLIQKSKTIQLEKTKQKDRTEQILEINQQRVHDKSKIKFKLNIPKKKQTLLKKYAIPIAFLCTIGIIVSIGGIIILFFAPDLIPFYG